jgi:uncharacterized GH25 family protein
MFNINVMLNGLKGRFTNDVINNAVQNLVNKGILEQYTDEDGDFSFELTKAGFGYAEELLKDPTSIMGFLDEEDEEDEDEEDENERTS